MSGVIKTFVIGGRAGRGALLRDWTRGNASFPLEALENLDALEALANL